MKPGPKPKPADRKLRRSFRLSQATVNRLDHVVSIGHANNATEAIERALEYCYGGKRRQFKG